VLDGLSLELEDFSAELERAGKELDGSSSTMDWCGAVQEREPGVMEGASPFLDRKCARRTGAREARNERVESWTVEARSWTE
jgi:hypothetical protein